MITSVASITDHIDILVMQPMHERDIVRDLLFAVMAFNTHGHGTPAEREAAALQVSFPLYTDAKVSGRGMLGPCVRITGPRERLYTLTLRHEVSGHLRAGRAMTLVRDNEVIEADRHERFSLLGGAEARALGRSTGGSVIASDKALRTGAASGFDVRPIVLSGQQRLVEMAGRLDLAVDQEALLVRRGEASRSIQGVVDPLGFSEQRTVPVIR